MKIVDLSAHIVKIPMVAHHDHEEEEHETHEHEHNALDPHVWTDPVNVAIIAEDICTAFSVYDPENAHYYQQNLATFKQKVSATDAKIRTILSTLPKDSSFMVFHPAWGYFAKAYGLRQLPVEIEGKEPKPKELMRLIDEAREEKVKAIFTQPEFSDATAKVISEELGIKVVKASSLSPDWSQGLIDLSTAIAGK